MQGGKIQNNFGRHFERNFWLYVISLLCFCTGIVLGIYTFKYMGVTEKSDMINYITSFSSSVKTTEIDNKKIFIETLKNNLPIVIALWVFGLTIVGIPLILVLDVIKGFTMGFSITFIINCMGIKGVWISLLGVMPQNIVYIPCIIIASVLGMELSMNKLKEKVSKNKTYFVYPKNISYTVTFFIIFLIMVFGFICEAYLSPNALKMISV